MKTFILTTALSIATLYASAQDAPADTSYWTKAGHFGVNFSQTSLTNWAGGGLNSVAVGGFFKGDLDYEKGRTTWENDAILGYGMTKLGDADFFKSEDRIDLASNWGRFAFKRWYYSAMANFKTQFDVGLDAPGGNKISNFMAPGYLILALGMDYKHSKKFSVKIAPVTGKSTFVRDQDLANAGAFGVDGAEVDGAGNIITPGANIRNEFGGYIRAVYDTPELVKDVALQSTLELFSNYMENPQNIDVDWTVLIMMKVNKYITASIGTHLKYDDDIKIARDTNDDGIIDKNGPITQFKQTLNVGFSIKF